MLRRQDEFPVHSITNNASVYFSNILEAWAIASQLLFVLPARNRGAVLSTPAPRFNGGRGESVVL